ncbi:DUF5327 family protein [Pseudogracilibacillus auburnensis]|uniref:YwdI family protein n=1 Tax=Pseudogracilibacillus auburnensis TaxID=1494959 RepID=A0A2V3W0J5_9BACI|nr:DUF5327 family protein [Pseudogracilibacillus auburnensis]PXW87420.1 hypothetical protein DFR56_10559 [Pseudogracilibacillus auburnensis]
MTISKDTVINKMMEELQAAKNSMHNNLEVINHISKVKLLSELILDEYEGEHQPKINEVTTLNNEQKSAEGQTATKHIPDDQSSIFDF